MDLVIAPSSPVTHPDFLLSGFPTVRWVGNSEYTAKRTEYLASTYALTKAIPTLAPEEWTPELLDDRQRRLAVRAVHLWRANFVR